MAKKLAVLFGIIFVIVGLIGFIPGDPIVGHAGAIFLTDWLHDLIHLLIGVILLIAAGKGNGASRTALKVFGVVYLILAIDGFFQPDMLLGFVTANSADTWLHLVLGIILLWAGMAGKSDMMMSSPSSSPTM